jgi:SAM-dependent methyltransferase
LQQHAADVQGHTLEIGDDSYTCRFGGDAVARADVLHVNAKAPGVTIVGDLAAAGHVASNAFDCFILTQTLQLIFDLERAVATIHRILKPGGVVLATVPGLSQLADNDWRDTWHWSFTPLSARRLFEAHFDAENVEVVAHGNVLAATAFLHGIAAGELRPDELDYQDPTYPLLITVRAVKSARLPLVEGNGRREASA